MESKESDFKLEDASEINHNPYLEAGVSSNCAKMDNKKVCEDKSEEKSIDSDDEAKPAFEHAAKISSYYNLVSTSEGRNKSKVFHLRNFNNWIKSVLVEDVISRLPDVRPRVLKVLDLCCGKGGDLIKWLSADTQHLVSVDFAEKRLEECEKRFKDIMPRYLRDRPCKHEIILADCTRVRIRGKFHDPSIRFDVVSCQFALHYSFESLPQAEYMLKNATECLKPGGFFFGTIPNANEIVRRIKTKKTNSFGNELYSFKMLCSEPYPLFGAIYEFSLENLVNVPEFLVHFPTFVKLAEKFGLKLVYVKRFDQIYEEKKNEFKFQRLLKKMSALEIYPPLDNDNSLKTLNEYHYAHIHWSSLSEQKRKSIGKLGTMSKSQWEVATMYHGFVFKKEC